VNLQIWVKDESGITIHGVRHRTVVRPTPAAAITQGSISELGRERGDPFANVRRLQKRRELLPADWPSVDPKPGQITTLPIPRTDHRRTAYAACDEPVFIVSGWGCVSTNRVFPLVLQTL